MPTLDELLAEQEQLDSVTKSQPVQGPAPLGAVARGLIGASAGRRGADASQAVLQAEAGRQRPAQEALAERKALIAQQVAKARSAESMDPTSGVSKKAQEAAKKIFSVLGKTYGINGEMDTSGLSEAQLKDMKLNDMAQFLAKQKLDREKIKAEKDKVIGGLTPGQKKVDQEFAKTLVEQETGKGVAEQASLKQLGEAKEILRTKQTSGPVLSTIPEAIRKFTNPASLDVSAKIRKAVTDQLRKTLGAQFTENEGERIFNQTFDPRLDEQTNIKRLEDLEASLRAASKAKQAQISHFKKFGTISNYNGPTAEEAFAQSQPQATDYTSGLKF